MGIFDRIGRVARASMNGLGERRPATDPAKPVSAMTDEELEEEILRRRRERAARRATGNTTSAERRTPQEQQIAQYYANLELPFGASVDDVRRQYREMMRQYHPDKHIGDPERHRAATTLAQSLTQAYQGLLAYLESK